MLAVRSNERAAAAAGINVRNTKLAGFGIAAFVAGMAGGLYAYNFGSVSYSRFGALAALALIAFTYFGGITMVSGAIIAGIGATEGLLPHGFDEWFGLSGNWALLIGGFALIITLLVNPEGIAGTGWEKKQQKKRRLAAEAATEERVLGPPVPHAQGSGEALPRKRREPGEVVLSATGISVSFGGLLALDEVDLTVREGQLVGLIGPNGAGKTTFIDAISGFVSYRGQVELDGRPLDGLAAHARAGARAGQDVAVDRAVRRSERAREPRGRFLSALGLGDDHRDGLEARHGARRRPMRLWSFSGSSRWQTRCRRSSPRRNASSWALGARLQRSRGSSVSTSRRRASTRGRARS